MEFKGTQGKWCYNHNMVATLEPIIDDIICLCPKLSSDKWEANAQLISKAPEMLEMLINIKDYLGSDVRVKVEQLIKEAIEL